MARHAWAKWNRGRSSHVPHSDGIGWSRLKSLVVEEHGVPVTEYISGKSPAPPRYFPLRGCSRRQSHHSDSLFIAGYKDSAVGGDVLQHDSPGCAEDQTLFNRAVDR